MRKRIMLCVAAVLAAVMLTVGVFTLTLTDKDKNVSAAEESRAVVAYVNVDNPDDSFGDGFSLSFKKLWLEQKGITASQFNELLYNYFAPLRTNVSDVYNHANTKKDSYGSIVYAEVSVEENAIIWQAETRVDSRNPDIYTFIEQVTYRDAAAYTRYHSEYTDFGLKYYMTKIKDPILVKGFFNDENRYYFDNPMDKFILELEKAADGQSSYEQLDVFMQQFIAKGITAAELKAGLALIDFNYVVYTNNFNGCSGVYDKVSGSRAFGWENKLTPVPGVPKDYYFIQYSPQQASWYGLAILLTAAFGGVLFLVFRNNEKTRKIWADVPPPGAPGGPNNPQNGGFNPFYGSQNPTPKPPVDPFNGLYGDTPAPTSSAQSPTPPQAGVFGGDYEGAAKDKSGTPDSAETDQNKPKS